VAAAYGDFRNADSSGFEFDLDTVGIPGGRHELTAQAITSTGATRDIGSIAIDIAQ